MKKKMLIISVVLIFLTLSYFLYKYFSNEKVQLINLDFSTRINEVKEYKYENYFVVGWLQVQGTNIDLPIFTSTISVVEENEPGSVDINYGWRNINYKQGENRLAIMGHNILNLSSKPMISNEFLTDFEELMSFVYHDFAEENLYVMYTDENGNEVIYMIYGVSFVNGSDDFGYSISNENKKEIDTYIDTVKKTSIYDYDLDVKNTDSLLSLFTCTRFFGATSKTSIKIDLRKLRDSEKTYKYDVKKNKNYDEIYKQLNEESV